MNSSYAWIKVDFPPWRFPVWQEKTISLFGVLVDRRRDLAFWGRNYTEVPPRSPEGKLARSHDNCRISDSIHGGSSGRCLFPVVANRCGMAESRKPVLKFEDDWAVFKTKSCTSNKTFSGSPRLGRSFLGSSKGSLNAFSA